MTVKRNYSNLTRWDDKFLLRIVLAFLSSKHVFCCHQFDVNLLWLALLIYHTRQLSRLSPIVVARSLEGLWSVSSDNLLIINKVIDTSPHLELGSVREFISLFQTHTKKWDRNLKPIKDDTQKKGRFLNKKGCTLGINYYLSTMEKRERGLSEIKNFLPFVHQQHEINSP